MKYVSKAKKKLTAALIIKTMQIIQESCVAFIENFVEIENVDTGEPVDFKLWPEQKRVLDIFHKERLTIVLKARQLGLTWLALAYSLWCLITKSGFKISALSRGEKEAQELVRRMTFMLRHLPEWMIVEGEHKNVLSWEGTTEKITVYHPGKEESTFVSFSASPDSGRTFTSSLVIIDEWAFQQWAEEIWTSAYPTINRPTGGKVIGLSTGKRGSFFEAVWNRAVSGVNGFKAVFLSWRADPKRDDKFYEQTKQALPNTFRQEYPNTMEDAFAVGQGAFFPEWNPEVHIIKDPTWYPPKYCQIYGAYDAGYGSFACFKWYAVFPNGQIVAYREYYPHNVTDLEQAKEIKRLSKDPEGKDEYIVSIFADPSCWNKQSSTGESTAEIFGNQGIYMLPADNDLKNGWRRLHQYLNPIVNQDGKLTSILKFTTNCANTIRTYPSIEQDKNNPEDAAKHSESHCFIKGTLITTLNGYIPIEKVKIGDYVLTRKGYKKVLASGITSKTKVYKAVFSNGSCLIGTPNHPIATTDGRWVDLSELKDTDNLICEASYKKCQEKQLFTTELNTTGIQNQNIGTTGYILSHAAQMSGMDINTCTKTYGKIITEKFLKIVTSITKTGIHLIIALKILSACRLNNTYHIMESYRSPLISTCSKCRKWLYNGINQLKVSNGIKSMPKNVLLIKRKLFVNAPIVGKKKKQLVIKKAIGSVQITVNRPGEGSKELITKKESALYVGKSLHATNTIKQKLALENAPHVLDICPMGIDTVYNLTIDECPEYFANGILVHNCQDVDRYLIMGRPAMVDSTAIMAGGFPSYKSKDDDIFIPPDDEDEDDTNITFYGY